MSPAPSNPAVSAPGSPSRRGRPVRLRGLIGPCVILLAAAVALTPQIVRGNSCGHDFDFHLVSWLDAHKLAAGNFLSALDAKRQLRCRRTAICFLPSAHVDDGRGSRHLILPWNLVPLALTFLLLAGTGLATRALASETLTDVRQHWPVAPRCFPATHFSRPTSARPSRRWPAASGFRCCCYLRCAIEIHQRRPLRRALDGSARSSCICHRRRLALEPAVGVMACYVLAALALRLLQSPVRGLRCCEPPSVRCSWNGLAAFISFPPAWEQRWVDIRQAIDDPGQNRKQLAVRAATQTPRLEFHDMVLHRASIIVGCHDSRRTLQLACLLAARPVARPALARPLVDSVGPDPARGLCSFSSLSHGHCGICCPSCVSCSFPGVGWWFLKRPWPSSFVWAIWPGNSVRLRLRVAAVLPARFFIAMTFVASFVFYQPCYTEDAVPAMLGAYRAGLGFGAPMSTSPSALTILVATGLPLACLVNDPATVLGKGGDDDTPPQWTSAQGSCQATFAAIFEPGGPQYQHLRDRRITPHAGYLISSPH